MFNLNHKAKRDLLTGMDYVRDNRLIAQRQYNYNVLGRPMTCDTRYPNKAIHHADTFVYNKRGESPRGLGVGLDKSAAFAPKGRGIHGARPSQLTGATLGEAPYAYSYDNIGNRITAQEDAQSVTYEANNLNQYTQIDTDGTAFVPEYDADGNQTRIQTVTGIWKVQYNGQNRAIRYESEADSTHIITCVYDSQGRRVEKKEEKEGAVISHVRYVYRGYLQVAAYDLLAEGLPSLWQIIWDPTQDIATRPLAIRADGAYSTYGWDLTKNICETYAGATGFLGHRYAYSPYGLVSLEGDTSYQPIQWSSEVYDEELGLNYYNYRYYNPGDGRWTRRDPMGDNEHLMSYVTNSPIDYIDYLGLISYTPDLNTCLLHVRLTWTISFLNDKTGKWTPKQIERWKLRMQDAVETYFNSYKNTYRCVSTSKCCKKCKNGIKVKFDLSYVSSQADYNVKVHYKKNFRSLTRRKKREAELSRRATEEVVKDLQGDTQVGGVHEVGHMLNLPHPGRKLPNPPVPNSREDYMADASSLMGAGHELRIDDFASAFCSQIPEVEGCSQWTVTIVQ